MSDTIHLVCLDAPSPPDYGGAIDMFYTIKALHDVGKSIILHSFNYNPSRHTKGLEKYCKKIHEYKRKHFFQAWPLSHPYIVRSRINKDLIRRLNEDRHPILLEGFHCSGIVPFLQAKDRIVVRIHNDEATYYGQLANAEKSFLKRCYFLLESLLLNRYQEQFDKAIQMACLSETDKQILEHKYHFQNIRFIRCFIPWQKVTSREGKGEYCLYHGNLAVSENEQAAIWLIKNIFSKLNIPLVVAGKEATKNLRHLTAKYDNVRLINNPPSDEMAALIRDAHIHVLPSMNNTGVKLKMLNALLNGRFCITNEAGVRGSSIEKNVIVKNTVDEWRNAIEELMQKEFTTSEKEERKSVLSLYNNQTNAQKLSALWKHYQ